MKDIFPRGFRSRLLLPVFAALLLGCNQTAPPEPAGSGVARPADTTGTPEPVSPETTPRPAGDPVRITFLGDSLSAGFGLPESRAFPALVQEQLRQRGHPVDVLNAGVSGDTTAGGLTRLDWVLRSNPELLVVELGGNDALRGQPLDNIERNLREIVRRGREAGARILLLGMDVPPSLGPDYTEGFAALYRRIAADERVELLPGFIFAIGTDPDLMQPDGIHPNAAGHEKLTERLVGALEKMLP